MLNDGFDDKFSATQKSSSIIVNQTYSFINNTGFYALANPVYYQYYYRFARRYGWWYDRFVPDFHNSQQGYFSTGIAHSIVDGIANQIIGKKLLLQNVGNQTDRDLANDSLRKAYSWADKAQLTSKARTATKYAGAFGTSLIKANASAGEIWLEALRFDDFFFETGFQGNLEAVTCLIKSYTDVRPTNIEWQDGFGEEVKQCLQGKYYLVEKRYFKDIQEVVNEKVMTHKVPFVVYQVHKYSGNITNAQSWDMNLRETMDAKSLPMKIRKAIGKDFGNVILGKEQRLPFFEDLGCELIQYNDCDGSLSQQPFGESILANIISDLMEYDLSFSYSIRDMYQGKGIVFIAKELQTSLMGGHAFDGLEDSLITWLNNWNDGKLPIDQVQFNLRVAEWREKRNAIFENIATKLHISPSSLASFLSDNTGRTAKEVTTETSSTDNYIEIQRGSIETPINNLLKTIALFYGWQDAVEIRFAKGGSQNVDTVIDREIKLVQAGLRHPHTALENIMIDADTWEIEEEWQRIQTYQQEQQQIKERMQSDMFGSMDFTGNTQLGGANEQAN